MTRLITREDLYSMKFLSRPRISPDGQQVAFVVTRIDDNKHEYRAALWLSSVDGTATRRFSAESGHTSDPAWSPDGRWLAFVSDREGDVPDKQSKEAKKLGKGKPQLWLIPTDGGEARQLTFMEHGASSPVWSPDSKQLLFSAAVGSTPEEGADGKPLPQARVIDRLWYRLDGAGYIYECRAHLFLLAINGGEPEQLTDGDWDDGEAAWSPDGTQIAFTSNHADDRWRMPGADIYTLALPAGKAGTLRRLSDGTLSCSSPSWSPDGKTIAFLGSYKVKSAGHTFLYRLASSGENQAPTNLSSDFVGTFMDWTNSDIGDEHLLPQPAWSPDGNTLYVLASLRGATRLFAVPAHGAGTEPPTLTPGDVHVRDFSIDAARGTITLLIGSVTRAQEIFVRSVEPSSEVRRITGLNDSLFDELTLAAAEYMPYKGADGWDIDGWILKPHDFDAAKKYPLVLEIHGGPQTQYGHGFFHEMQLLVAQGYVVLYTNPRGSCGYGYDFSLAVRGAWGEKPAIDIMNGVDELVRRGYIDEQRLGVTGGSYGGFMTNWLVGHTDRFKVAVTDRCVSNMATLFGTSDVGWDLAGEDLDTTPWENLQKYMQMSPIHYVENIHTPLLILHSEQDLRCNIEQAEQLFTALKYMGREVLLVRFEGQSHGLSRGGHPKLRLERLNHIMSWFGKYLS
jgi:dipeptidyl aminopeptidase/acylaminoacyl peptidase